MDEAVPKARGRGERAGQVGRDDPQLPDLEEAPVILLGTSAPSSAARCALMSSAASLPGGAGVVLDLLFASSGIESEVVMAADPLEVFPGLLLPVATTGHLIALKVLARDDRTRPQDRVDLVALLAVATAADLGQTRAALTLIAERGYHRGKNLLAELDALLAGRSR